MTRILSAADFEARAQWVSDRYHDALAARPLQDAGIVLRDLEALWEHRQRHLCGDETTEAPEATP